ncbi:MAG: DUF5686 and carboxypeptidase regulatory-like domain-containing protein [Bacteroidales bacterium]
MLRIITFIVFFFLCGLQGYSQLLKGTVTDQKKENIPFATIYIEELQQGTTSNMDGYYELLLDPGKYKILFRCMGFKPVTKEIIIDNGSQVLDVRLEPEIIRLKEVVISNKREDPAYGIMRKVIASAPYHLHQVSHYNSEVYLKGTIVFEKIPKIIAKNMKLQANGKEVIIKNGDVFVEESINNLTFDAPDSYKQEVKSLRNTMPVGDAEPVTPIDLIKASFYTPTVFEDIMPCISPLAPNAFAHYKFRYEGFSEENGFVIDKISVIPRRESQQLFRGTIYIIDNDWSLYSLSLTNEQFWGTMKIDQLYAPMPGQSWLPVSHNIHLDGSYLGVKAQFIYTSSVKYRNITLNEKFVGAVKNSGKESSTFNEKIPLADVKSNRDMRKASKTANTATQARDTVKSLEIIPSIKMTVLPGAVKKDSAYWNQVRPVPLSRSEIKVIDQYEENKSSPVADSARTNKKKRSGKFFWIMGMQSWQLCDSTVRFRYDGLIKLSQLNFNTVDGFHYQQGININYTIDTTHALFLRARGRYAVSRNVFTGIVNGNYTYAPLHRGVVYYSFGRTSLDFVNGQGIQQRENSVASLFFRYNPLKLYDKTYLSLQNRIDLSNGLESSLGFDWFRGRTLENHTDFSFYPSKDKSYSDNIPDHDFFKEDSSAQWTSFSLHASINYTPEYYYRMDRGRKQMVRSRFPTYSLGFRIAIPDIFNSRSSYALAMAGIRQEVKLKAWRELKYSFSAGYYIYNKSIWFPEFRHFNTQHMPVVMGSFGPSYQLLEYYKYSSSEWYLNGHVQYETPLLVIKRLPFFSERLWDEALSFNLLSTPDLPAYGEFGYGLLNVGGLVDAGIYAGFEGVKFHGWGVKILLGLFDE